MKDLPAIFLVACRSLSDYEKSGHTVQPGFPIRECRICSARVAVSPQGIEQEQHGGVLACNRCAFEVARRLRSAGKDVELLENEAAREGMDRILARLGVNL
jgi:hypothetical protein